MNNIVCIAICKNEEHNVDDFVLNLKNFNIAALFVLDTGSTDKTIEKLKKYNFVKLIEKSIEPFDFSIARNYLRDFVKESIKNLDLSLSKFDDLFFLHLDLDERIIGLPEFDSNKKAAFSGERHELLYQMKKDGFVRITPGLSYQYVYPIHELIEHNYHVVVSETFKIAHSQEAQKDRYEYMTEKYFRKFPENLFFHHLMDCFRLEEYQKVINIYLEFKKTSAFFSLNPQQKWHSVRNYQISLLQLGRKPDQQDFQIFNRYLSKSSCLYLTLFYFELNEIKEAFKYYKMSKTINDVSLNECFYNIKIEEFVENKIRPNINYDL